MNFTPNWRDRRTDFRPMHYSIANYSTDTKKEMRTTFGEDLFLNNLHLIPDPLKKNLADTIITEEKMAPKSKLDQNIGVETNDDMHDIAPDYSPLSGITSFFSGVMSVISNAMFSRRQRAAAGAEPRGQVAVPAMWQPAKLADENKMLHDENHSNDKCSEPSAPDMTDCRQAAAHCQNKIEQVRLLLGSQPVPCSFRARRRPKRVFVDASSLEDNFEDAFSPEDFENIANDSYIQYSSPVCFHDQFFHEVDSPKVKTETRPPAPVPEVPAVCETTEIVTSVPEVDTVNESKLVCDMKQELVASCEDKLSKLKALLQERRRKSKTTVEPEPVSVHTEPAQDAHRPKPATKVKDKRFKNPNRTSSKRMKSKMRKNIEDDLCFANEVNIDDLSSVENSPSMGCFEKYISNQHQQPAPTKTEKEFFDEVSGRFLPGSVTESEDSFQIVFNDCPKLRRSSDCESEDSFIVFEESPDSCYTSNDVFGDSSDDDDYDSESDSGDSGCGDYQFKLAASLSKSVCNLADASLYAEPEPGADEVDFVSDTAAGKPVEPELHTGGQRAGLLIDDRKKLLRKDLPPKRVQFSREPPRVHVLRVWAFAARQARAGHWERLALDRDRFKRRIADVEVAVSWVLRPQHRARVLFQRFMPWWHAERRRAARQALPGTGDVPTDKVTEDTGNDTENRKTDDNKPHTDVNSLQIIPVNEKILELNTDLVAHAVVDT